MDWFLQGLESYQAGQSARCQRRLSGSLRPPERDHFSGPLPERPVSLRPAAGGMPREADASVATAAADTDSLAACCCTVSAGRRASGKPPHGGCPALVPHGKRATGRAGDSPAQEEAATTEFASARADFDRALHMKLEAQTR